MEPVIYLTAIPMGTGSGAVHGSTRGGDVLACALAEDGIGLGTHVSSNVTFAKHDIGLTSEWHHKAYRAHYPDGYRVEWVDDREAHAGYQAAMALNAKHYDEAQRVEVTEN